MLPTASWASVDDGAICARDDCFAIPFLQVDGLVVAGVLVLSNHTKDKSICVSGRKEGLWLPTNVLPFVGLPPPPVTHLPILSVLGTHQAWVRARRMAWAGSSQGIEVHMWQWFPPIAEVAVLRVGQVCAGATHHGWEKKLHHLPEPLVPVGQNGLH